MAEHVFTLELSDFQLAQLKTLAEAEDRDPADLLQALAMASLAVSYFRSEVTRRKSAQRRQGTFGFALVEGDAAGAIRSFYRDSGDPYPAAPRFTRSGAPRDCFASGIEATRGESAPAALSGTDEPGMKGEAHLYILSSAGQTMIWDVPAHATCMTRRR